MHSNDEIIALLESLRKERGYSISELARRVGMAKSAVSRYFNKTREFPLNRADDFAKALGTTPEHLLGINPTNVKPITEVVNIPIIGKIACGDPITAEENISEYMPYPKGLLPSGEIYYLRAEGDSMLPKIPSGSLVMCRKQENVENGSVAAVLVNNDEEATLKKVRKVNEMIILEPLNDAYEPYVITENNPARIIGKALKVLSDL